MRKSILCLNLFLFVVASLLALNSFSVRGHDLIQKAWAAACGAANMCGSGTVSYLASFTNAQAPVSYTIGNSTINAESAAVGVEHVRITTAGNVGIGTTNPLAKLHVNGAMFVNDTILGTGGLQFYGDTSSSIGMRLLQNGNVGIGTTAPAGLLQVGSAGGSFPGCNNAYLCAVNSDQGNGRDVFRIGTNLSGQVMVFNNSGNVGIGATNPAEKLHIGGPSSGPANLRFTWDDSQYPTNINTFHSAVSGESYMAFAIDTGPATQAEVVRFKANGNVGIGTTVPQAKLDVNGAIRLAPGAPTGTLVNGMMWMVP